MLAVGIVVGAVGAALVLGFRSDRPTDLGSGLKHLIEVSRSKAPATPLQQSGTDDSPAPAAPSFDFYTVLPEIEKVLPKDPGPAPTAEPKPNAEVLPPATTGSDSGGYYMLQAGSFARQEDADALRARLALSGLEASIQKVTIQGRGDFFRVRLGPFASMADLAGTDQRLQAQGISALRLKVSSGI